MTSNVGRHVKEKKKKIAMGGGRGESKKTGNLLKNAIAEIREKLFNFNIEME